ncbi:MFS transporter [Aquimarina sp. 2201CG1-2-11]|uniref:MFS transporter n=1 Tax=Aquimarina discodermiae TaxID=3231043 RepID=UPI003461A066
MLLIKSTIISKDQSPSFRGALRASGVMAFAGLGDAILYPVLPIYGKELGFSVFFIGVLLSINRFVRIIANTHIANWVQRIGMRKILIVTSLVATVTTFMYGLKLGFICFLIARVLWGLSYSGLKIATLHYASQAKQKSGLAFGISQSLKSLGALGILWFGPILIDNFGIQNGLFSIALISLLGVFLAYSLPKMEAKPKSNSVKVNLTFYPNATNLLVFILSVSIDGILVVSLSYLLSGSIANSNELLVYVAFYLLIKRLFVLFFSIIGGILTIYFRPLLLFLFSISICLFAMILIAFDYTILGIVLAFLFNTIVVTFSPLIAIQKQEEDNPLQAISSVTTWWDLGAAIGAFIGIYAVEYLGVQNLYASLCIVGTILFINFYMRYAKSNRSIL